MQTAEILKTLEDIADVGIVNYKQTDAVREAIVLLKAQYPKHGHWNVLENCSNAGVYCSECQTKVFDRYPMEAKLSMYCPHCGANMDGAVTKL